MKETNKRILIFNVNWLGDVLFSTATIRNLRYRFPGSFIACIVPSPCYSILKGNPYLDEIIIFDEKDRHRGIISKLSFIQYLKRKKFDTVFLLHRSFTRALLCRIAGIPQRIGYDTKKRHFILTQAITPPKKDTIHRIDYYLKVIEQAGIKVEDRFLDFFVSENDLKIVDELLQEKQIKKDDFLVAVNPGGNWFPKRWPKEYWAILSDKLIRDFCAKVVITGGHRDLKLAEEIEVLMEQKPLIACGKLNIKGFAALCKKLDLFITADTGPLHIANSMGAKNIIALFGPTSPHITGPQPSKNVLILQKDIGCRIPCYKVDCSDNRCMKALRPDEVIEQVKLIKSDINGAN